MGAAVIDPRKIWSSPTLPTLPAVAVRLLEVAGNPDVEIRDVVSLVAGDPALAAKILRAANSSYFGLRSTVTSIDRAVPLLGTAAVSSLALSFSLSEHAIGKGPLADHFRDYWRQSLVKACAAEVLRADGEPKACEFFVAGLLIDIGRLAMLKTIPTEYAKVIEAARKDDRPLSSIEREQLGFDHVAVGTRLLEEWSMPEAIVEASRAPSHALAHLAALDGPTAGLQRAIAVATATGEYFCAEKKGAALERLRVLGAALYDFGQNELHEYVERTRSRIDEAGELFAVDTSRIQSPSELMALANEHLSMIAVRASAATMEAEARREAATQRQLELETQNRELRKQTVRDPLTKLYNRSFLDETLANEITRARREALTVGVLFADVDRFKSVNDTYGHAVGDRVLVHVANVLLDVTRGSDVVARFGGEEFVVLVPNPTENGLHRLAERFRSRVESQPVPCEGFEVPVTISVGGTLLVPPRSHDDSAARLLMTADAAMYEAKRSGRNQVRINNLLGDFEQRVVQVATTSRFSRWLVEKGHFDIPTLSEVLLACQPNRTRIGELGIRHGLLDDESLDRVLEEQFSSPDRRFGEIAHALGLLTVEHVGWLLGQQQESVTDFVALLVSHGLTDQTTADALLREYLDIHAAAKAAGNERRGEKIAASSATNS